MSGIKFRLIRGVTVIGYEINQGGNWLYSHVRIASGYSSRRIRHDVKDQSTGRQDSEGIEIYRNDIVDMQGYAALGYELTVRGVIVENYGQWAIKYRMDDGCGERYYPLTDLYYEKKSHYVPNVGDVLDSCDRPNCVLKVFGIRWQIQELL